MPNKAQVAAATTTATTTTTISPTTQTLMESGLQATLVPAPITGIIARYKLWRSLPPDERPASIQTKQDFATYYGVSLSTLRQWEADPKFWEDTFALAKNILGSKLADVLHALADRAMTGNIPAVKLFLEVLGVHHEKIEHTVDFEDDRLVVIMPAGAALPPHLQRATNEPARLDDDGLKFELIEQGPDPAIAQKHEERQRRLR